MACDSNPLCIYGWVNCPDRQRCRWAIKKKAELEAKNDRPLFVQVAGAVGWTHIYYQESKVRWGWVGIPLGGENDEDIPDYLNDYNALMELLIERKFEVDCAHAQAEDGIVTKWTVRVFVDSSKHEGTAEGEDAFIEAAHAALIAAGENDD